MLAMAAGSAQAGLTGDTVMTEYQFPSPGSFSPSQTATVGPGIEFSDIEGRFDADFTNTQLIMTFNSSSIWNPSAQNGPTFADQTNAFTSFSIDAATTATWFNASMLALDGTGNLNINWEGQSFSNGQIIVLDLATVPEPASTAILGAGLVGFGAVRRRC